MTTTDASRVWTILGGLHLDLIGDVHRSWFRSGAEEQHWTDWTVQFGGVGGNIASHLAEVQAKSLLLAVVGSDGWGGVLSERLNDELSTVRTELVVVPEAATGVVAVLNVDDSDEKARQLIGPRLSAVDLLSPGQAQPVIERAAGISSDLIVDGYILHRRQAVWLPLLHALKSAKWRIHLELVPHGAWRDLDDDTFDALVSACASVSSTMSTLERVLGLRPEAGLPPSARASRVVERVAELGWKDHATIYARFGLKEAEYCLRLSASAAPHLRRYDTRLILGQTRGTQDRIFVHELVGCSAELGGAEISV